MIGVAAVSKYPAELKERAVAMARDLERELGPGRGAIARVAAQLGIHPEALRYWVRRDEAGHPPTEPAQLAPASAEAERIAELERENREFAAGERNPETRVRFFANEMDTRPPR